MTNIKYYLIILALICSACSTTYYKNPYPGDEAFEQDAANCEIIAGQSNVNLFHSYDDYVKLCMRGKGWTTKQFSTIKE